jgi:hypothetical protein
MSVEALHEIRDALNHELVLGRSYLTDKIEEMTKRQTRLGQPERHRVEEVLLGCALAFIVYTTVNW